MTAPQSILAPIAEALDGLGVAMCVFDEVDATLLWNRTFVELFPEHAEDIHVGEPYSANLRRFYMGRLSSTELPLIDRYITEGVQRHRSQQRPYEFEHRGRHIKVASLPLAGIGRVRIWTASLLEQEAIHAPMAEEASRAKEQAPIGAEMFDRIADAVMVTASDNRIVWVNEPFVRMYDLQDRTAAIGALFGEVYRAAWEGHAQHETSAYEQGLSILAESLRFSGAPFEMPLPGDRCCRAIEQRDADGRGFFVHVDITLLKRQQRDLIAAERAARLAQEQLARKSDELVASELRYRAIVEDQSEFISLARPDGVLTFVNAAYAQHFGQLPQDMIGRSLYDFVDPQDRGAVVDHLSAVFVGGRVASNVNRMCSANQGVRWVAWINRPLLDAEGAVVAMQSVGRDITEQRAAQEALAESEARFRRLYESTPAILHSIDKQGRLLHVSDRWLQLFGYAREEALGRPSVDFLAPESRTRAVQTILPAFLATGRCERVPYQFVAKDGHLVDVLLSAILERDAEGNALRSLAVLEDVSEVHRLSAELAEAHAQLDALVANVPAMLGYWDREQRTRFVNREFQAAAGMPTATMVGWSFQRLFEALDTRAYQSLRPCVAEVLRGNRQELELALLTTEGLRQLRMTLIPHQPRSAEVAGFFGMAVDITGRKALELRLRDSEQRYRSLFDNLNSGFALHEVIVDSAGAPADYKFLAMNAAFASMGGLDAASSVGRRISELASNLGDGLARRITALGRVALDGVPIHFEERVETTQGWYEMVAFRPAPGQFAVIAQDITQRKVAEQGLQLALQEKETLLKEVYHRVKNNLQVVQSLLSLQQRSMDDGPGCAALEDSVQRVRAMALIHEKLYQSGNLAGISLADYVQDLVKQIAEASGAGKRGVEIRARIADVAVGLDNAIPFGLLVTELVANSLKHGFPGERGGEVLVELSIPAGVPRLRVWDDGVGLPPALDVERSTTMGLQVAVSLARQLGGRLRANAGAHAEFVAELPRLALVNRDTDKEPQ